MIWGEEMKCPRRPEGPFVFPEEDQWETDRWGQREEDVWNWSWSPRTCSFCGGAHPEDVFKLIEEGWELDKTDKCYKAYLEPPGYAQAHAATLRAIRASKGGDLDTSRIPSVWSPVPPVKVYTQHFTKEQVDRLNVAMKEQA